jgi:hypothetical protein
MARASAAGLIVALMALPCCHSFAMVPAGRLAPALGARARPLRRLVISAALSDGKEVKPSDANAYAAASSSVTLRRSDEAVMEAVTEAGRQELKDLADLNKKEQEELRKKLEEVCRAFAQAACALHGFATRPASAPPLRLLLHGCPRTYLTRGGGDGRRRRPPSRRSLWQ